MRWVDPTLSSRATVASPRGRYGTLRKINPHLRIYCDVMSQPTPSSTTALANIIPISIPQSAANSDILDTLQAKMGTKKAVQVGAKLEVQWPSDSEYYPCTIVDYNASKNRVKVVYPRCDNAIEEFRLSDRVWRIAKRSRGRPLQDMLVGKHIDIVNDETLAETFHSRSPILRCFVLRKAGPARYDLLLLRSDRIAKGQTLVGVEYTVNDSHVRSAIEPISDHNNICYDNDNLNDMDVDMDIDIGMHLPHSPELSSVGDSNLIPPPSAVPPHMPLMGVPPVERLLLDPAPLFPPPPMPHGIIYSHETNGRPNEGSGFDAGAVLDFVAAGGTVEDDVQIDSNCDNANKEKEHRGEGGNGVENDGTYKMDEVAHESDADEEEEGEVKEEPGIKRVDAHGAIENAGDQKQNIGDDETDTKGRSAVDKFVQVSSQMDEPSRLAYVVGYSKSKRAHHLAWIDSVETSRALITRPHELLDQVPEHYSNSKKRSAPDSNTSLSNSSSPGVAAKRPRVSALSMSRKTRELVGRWITMHGNRYRALVVGYKEGRHLIYSSRDERVEEVRLSEIEWAPCELGEEKEVGGMVGKRIVVLDKSSPDDDEGEEDEEEEEEEDNDGTTTTKTEKELLFEAFIVERLSAAKYKLLYTYTGMMLVEDLRNKHRHWDLVPNDATEFRGKKIVSWSKSNRSSNI